MATTKTEVRLSKEVSGGATEYDESFVPATGDFYITDFCGEGAYNANCAVELIWDHGGTEEVLWTIKGGGVMPGEIKRTGNGTKKLALVLDNGLQGAVLMSGFFKAVQET